MMQELRKQCQDFATALLDHTRSSFELEVLLNHDPVGPAFQPGDRMSLSRLKLAIKYRQKRVSVYQISMPQPYYVGPVAHAVCRTFQRPAAFGVNMVRRVAGISAEKYAAPEHGSDSHWTFISAFLALLRPGALLSSRKNTPKAFHQVHMPFCFVFHLSV